MRVDTWPLLVFARVPRVGEVKTRLIPALGAQGACDLHRQLVWATLQRACAARGAQVQLWVAGEPTDAFVQHCVQHFGVPVFEQRGADLGLRMADAFERALSGRDSTSRCVLIGTDCPAQTVDDLEQAERALLTHEAVLQPAEDGGYVLLALKRARGELFEAIDWGGPHVTERTVQRARSLGLTLQLLRTVPDLDDAQDLERALALGWIENHFRNQSVAGRARGKPG
jgi:rSAM/selenodomain-associated transferase 1